MNMYTWILTDNYRFYKTVWVRLLNGGYALTEPMGLDKPLRSVSEYPKPKPRKHGMIGKETKKLGNLSHL